jgi:signal transduction histidine kinase
VDDGGRLLATNATLCRMLRCDAATLPGKHIDALLTTASRIFYQTHVFPMMKLEAEVAEIHLAMLRADGSEVPVIFNAARRPHAQPPRSDCVVVETRQRSEYEAALIAARRTAEDASRAKDDFLAHVSHELRTPLTSIAGWAHMLAAGQLNGEARGRAIEAIVRNTRAQTKLIDDMLDFARITAGKLRLEVAPLDLRTVVESALELIAPAAAARHITLERHFEDDLPPILGDSDRLQQVLSNIASNAVKFTPKGGRIVASVGPINSSIEISVTDTGRGIPPEFLPFVFERFRQADDAALRAGGLGLGMSITRHLVELHGGTVRAESEGEGKGSTFIVRLPVAARVKASRHAALAGARDATLPAAPDLAHLHVLVVDDDVETRQLLHALLTGRGARVSSAANADEAVRHFREDRPDLLVSDIDLGQAEDGYALLKRLKEIAGDSRLPAIALTARARAADRLGAIAAGFQVHLPKPVDPAELVMTISNLA